MGMSAAIGLTVAGGLTTASGQNQAGKYNQQVANVNAQIAEWQAEDALARGREQVTRQREYIRQLTGSQRARLAAQGIDIDSGSALDVQLDTARSGELDVLAIENAARREAWGYRVQAQDYRTRGAIARYEGRQAAVGTLLTTGDKAYGQSSGLPTYTRFDTKPGTGYD